MDDSIKPRTLYRHTADMGEISGFGGVYEEHCQLMLDAGARYIIDNNIHSDQLKIGSLKNVFGITFPESPEAKALEDVILKACGDEGCSGAMMHATMHRCYAIADKGWDWYCATLREAEAMEKTVGKAGDGES